MEKTDNNGQTGNSVQWPVYESYAVAEISEMRSTVAEELPGLARHHLVAQGSVKSTFSLLDEHEMERCLSDFVEIRDVDSVNDYSSRWGLPASKEVATDADISRARRIGLSRIAGGARLDELLEAAAAIKLLQHLIKGVKHQNLRLLKSLFHPTHSDYAQFKPKWEEFKGHYVSLNHAPHKREYSISIDKAWMKSGFLELHAAEKFLAESFDQLLDGVSPSLESLQTEKGSKWISVLKPHTPWEAIALSLRRQFLGAVSLNLECRFCGKRLPQSKTKPHIYCDARCQKNGSRSLGRITGRRE